MAGSGKFTMVLTERELSLLADACEVAADSGGTSMWSPITFNDMARTLDRRLRW